MEIERVVEVNANFEDGVAGYSQVTAEGGHVIDFE